MLWWLVRRQPSGHPQSTRLCVQPQRPSEEDRSDPHTGLQVVSVKPGQPSSCKHSLTLFNCSHLYFTWKSKVKICVFFFFPPILKKAQTDQTKSFWIPWNGRWWAGAAEDLRQRTQPSLLPQRQLHAPPSPGDGSGQRGWEGSRVAQGEDRNGEKDLTSSSTFPSEHQLSPRLHGLASLCLLGKERRDRPFTAAPLTECLAFVNDPV